MGEGRRFCIIISSSQIFLLTSAMSLEYNAIRAILVRYIGGSQPPGWGVSAEPFQDGALPACGDLIRLAVWLTADLEDWFGRR